MLAKTLSAAVIGIDAYPIEVEVNAQGIGDLSIVSIVGLPDLAVKESRDRIKSAMHSSGLIHPEGSTIVNLAPADLKKEGASFDLAIAIGMLAGSRQVKRDRLARCAMVGELALDGSIRPVKGVLPIAAALSKLTEVEALLVPVANRDEAALGAGNLPVYPVSHLLEAVSFFNHNDLLSYQSSLQTTLRDNEFLPDFNEVKGQLMAKRAMEIAAAGGHNSIMIGPPGTGKSMLASRLPSILPPMTLPETLESSRVYSVLGMLSGKSLITERPYRAPHHTISDVALIGGGKDPRPGEISMAHNGVLFMDELPEFKRNVLEVLRQPLENGFIHVSRASGNCIFPAKFMLVAAMNPCPCGRGDAELGCHCKVDEKRRYLKKVSGPLLDRIDLHIELQQLSQNELLNAPDGESSATIRERVIRARNVQLARFTSSNLYCNAHMSSRELQKYCQVPPSGQLLLRQAIARFKLSPRAFDRILKVARTIADLNGSAGIKDEHIFEAVSYRKAEIGE